MYHAFGFLKLSPKRIQDFHLRVDKTGASGENRRQCHVKVSTILATICCAFQRLDGSVKGRLIKAFNWHLETRDTQDFTHYCIHFSCHFHCQYELVNTYYGARSVGPIFGSRAKSENRGFFLGGAFLVSARIASRESQTRLSMPTSQ